MPRFKNVNGERIQFTAAEETARDAEETQAVIDKQAEETAEANAIAKKASGKQKLLDLGLTTEEVKALIGL
jgi:hypothetical protein|tara:strand:+ start:398 stop:610 length:213 start_codon:yes stop_codon:yes gene_type:complete